MSAINKTQSVQRMSSIDHWHMSDVVCPQCGTKATRPEEIPDGCETDCGNCGAIYIVFREVSVLYTTELVDGGGE